MSEESTTLECRQCGTGTAEPEAASPGVGSHFRNAKKLAIALDALREIRGAGSVAHTKAQTALDRIAALGPSLDEVLPGEDDEGPLIPQCAACGLWHYPACGDL